MRAPRLIAGLTLLVAAMVPARAAEPGKVQVCVFPEGTAWVHEKGAFSARPVEAFSIEIEAIDATAQTARLRTKGSEVAVRLVQAVDARHFIEVTVEGFLNLTTLYEREGAPGVMTAAHTRHSAVLGEPVVSQYRGSCKPKD